jgi:hypothetical protein
MIGHQEMQLSQKSISTLTGEHRTHTSCAFLKILPFYIVKLFYIKARKVVCVKFCNKATADG